MCFPGDPGLGKSQLLQAAASVAPRGIYVCGNTTTNAGLTVAVVKDAMTGDYAFEAGNFLLACFNCVSCVGFSVMLVPSVFELAYDGTGFDVKFVFKCIGSLIALHI
jgi:hypothetical protein